MSMVDDEDELSTGALGDAENSDAHVPSSTEDVGDGFGGKVMRRKRGIVNSLFGSFGKSGGGSGSGVGSNSRGSISSTGEPRSQFFLDSSETY